MVCRFGMLLGGLGLAGLFVGILRFLLGGSGGPWLIRGIWVIELLIKSP